MMIAQFYQFINQNSTCIAYFLDVPLSTSKTDYLRRLGNLLPSREKKERETNHAIEHDLDWHKSSNFQQNFISSIGNESSFALTRNRPV